MISFRNYMVSDFPEILKLVQSSHDLDSVTEELMHEKLYEDPAWMPENCWIAEFRREIIGFQFSVVREIREQKICFVKLMAVAKNYRRRGVGTRLLQKSLDLARENRCNKIRFYDSTLNYLMPGIDPGYTAAVCFAEKHGFIKWDLAINMEVSLDYSDWECGKEIKKLKTKGVEIRRAEITDLDSLLKLLDEKWPLWKNELSVAMVNNPVSAFLAFKDQKVMAFAAYHGNNRGTGWFGPMGTHPELRGMGIGGVLLKLCMKDLNSMGFQKSIIPWVDPVKFYSDYAAARISRVFYRYEKEIQYE